MTYEKALQQIREAREKNFTGLDLSGHRLTQLPPEISQLKNLTILNLRINKLTLLPPKIAQLKNLTTLDLSYNQLTQLPLEITQLKDLTTLDLSHNWLTQLPPEISQLKNLTTLDLSWNQLTQLSPEIIHLENLTTLIYRNNQLTQLPPEIAQLKNLTTFDLSHNQLTQLPPEIAQLKNLTRLIYRNNQLTQLPTEIAQLKNLKTLNLVDNQLTQLPLEITQLKDLTTLDLSHNQLTQLPPEISQLKNLKSLNLSHNQLTQLPSEITQLKNLTTLDLNENPLTSPPPEIVSRGLEAIFTFLKQTRTTENNEAKLLLVGNGDVGKTCLAYRLTNNTFLRDTEITEGINISKMEISAPDSEYSKIKLNIWDFGGREIYHAVHQFFLTKRSIYLLVWNARKAKDYDYIYYWLHAIEAFGENSPIILVMSKMYESDDDLNLKELKSRFPQIVDYLKIDSIDGTGINRLIGTIRRTAWELPLTKAKWVDSWFRVRRKLEELRENWISYDEFYKICISECLDDDDINVLDDYLNDLGVTLHIKDRLSLKNIVILKPEWVTNAFYKILSTQSIIDNEGELSQNELEQIWDYQTYPVNIHPHLMELMNKFELSYELPNKNRYLVAELLPKSPPDLEWNKNDNLCFYYSYDYFLPPGIITRFIVRMHQNIEKKENGMPLCWREGAVLKLKNSHALVEMKPDERLIEIRVEGGNKRGALGAICSQLDHINANIKKIKVSKQVPCNCSSNCTEKFSFETLLKAEIRNIETIQCHESLKLISVSILLDGYKKREERFEEYNENIRPLIPTFKTSSSLSQIISPSIEEGKQRTEVEADIIVNLKIDIPQIHTEFDNLKEELENLSPKLYSDLVRIQDSLDEISATSDKEKLVKPFNKLYRFLEKLNDPNSDYNKLIIRTQKGIELAQNVSRTYNRFAQWLPIPQLQYYLGK